MRHEACYKKYTRACGPSASPLLSYFPAAVGCGVHDAHAAHAPPTWRCHLGPRDLEPIAIPIVNDSKSIALV